MFNNSFKKFFFLGSMFLLLATRLMAEGATPMIEVSVDIIEIKETKQDTKGVTWNETLNFEEALKSPAGFNFENTTTKVPMGEGFGNPRGIMPGFTIGSMARYSPLAAALRIMITDNKARILANPKLATESGSQASFVVGGEIPVPVVSPQGTSIEWKTYGINLQVKPEVNKSKDIAAQIQVSVSDLDYANSVKLSGYDVPALLNRSANSKINVADGGTVVIAGLKHARKEETSKRVPILSKIPIIGWFFKSKSDQDSDTSMVVFVTFKIVEREKENTEK